MKEEIINMLEKDIEDITSLRESGLYKKVESYLLKRYAKKIIERIKMMEVNND